MSNKDDNIWEKNKLSQTEFIPSNTALKKSPIDINYKRVLSVWPYILLSGIVGILSGILYMRYVDTVYNASTSIIIEESLGTTGGLIFSKSQRDPFNDRVSFIKSPTIANLLVDSLKLQYHSIAEGRIKNKDYYGLLKWSIINRNLNSPEIAFTIVPNKKGFRYSYEGVKGNGQWDQPIMIQGGQVVFNKPERELSETSIECYSTNTLSTSFAISNKLVVTAGTENNGINLGYSDISATRATDILNSLINIYNNEIEKEKKLSYVQAIDFIDKRIAPLGSELDSLETELAHYKSSKRFIGNTANGSIYMGKVQGGEDQLKSMNNLKSLISNVENFINNPLLPEQSIVLMGIGDGVLQGSMRSFQEARRERDRLLLTQTPNNPSLIFAEKNLKEQRENLGIQLENYKNQLATNEANYKANLTEADRLLRATPMEEKELIDKHRMMGIKENLFLSLLQKKEEAAIAKASVTVNTKILYPPVILNSDQYPKKSKVLSISLLIGLILPLIYALVRELMNNKIISKKQLQGMTNIPVIAELEQTELIEGMGAFAIAKDKRSMFGEQVRTLRTNLDFYKGLNKPVSYIMLTSSISGEGKSFLSVNIAKSYALQGKRVALLEFDLRRPKIAKSFNVPSDHLGLSTLLIGKCKPADCIFNLSDEANEKFDLFVSGPIPPNPQELISGNIMLDLKEYLDNNYDIVVIDTPPFGMVADAQILGKWADITLIVARYYQTIFDQVNEVNEWNENGLLPNISFLLNGVRQTGYFGNRYGYYYYRRKYGYGYYTYGYYSGKGKDLKEKKKGVY